MSGTILLYSRDPGGTEQLIAVREALAALMHGGTPSWLDRGTLRFLAGLQAGHPATRVAARDVGVAWWRRAGVDPEDWTGLSVGECIVRMRDAAPAHLLTATTDVDDRTDAALWEAARSLGIPATAFLDHSVNLVERFRSRDGRLVYPDRIFVLDDASRRTLSDAGVPAAGIAVCGNLHLARIGSLPQSSAAALRCLWGVADDGEQVILFAGENAREMALAGRPAAYDELGCLAAVIAALDDGLPLAPEADAGPQHWLLVVRPHPKDAAGKYHGFRREHPNAVIVSDAGSASEAIDAANLVVGMRSSLLDLARLRGRPTAVIVDEGGALRLSAAAPTDGLR